MAEPLKYTPTPPKIGPDAHQELERLLQTAHEHGALRLANDLIAANREWTQVVVDGLNKEGSRRAVQNLAMLPMLLSRIEPNQFYKVLSAAKDALECVARPRPKKSGQDDAPGIKGAYKLLQDDTLWHALAPLVDALKAFGEGLDRDVHKPISAFSGKPTKDS